MKRPTEKWGGRKRQATVNGKGVCVKKDPHTLTYFMNPPKEDGSWQTACQSHRETDKSRLGLLCS